MHSSRPVETPSGANGHDVKRVNPRRDRTAAIIISAAAHLAALLAIFAVHAPVQQMFDEPPPTEVSLVAPPRPQGPGAAGAPAPSRGVVHSAAEAVVKVHPTPAAPSLAATLTAAKVAAPQQAPNLSAAELAGAATADGEGGAGSGQGGGGGGGGSCNMIRRLQLALRKDHLVQIAALTPTTAGKAVRVWDGDWVQSGGEDGRGLAAVREAIIWEVGFAPEACKAQTQHGLVVLSLADGPGATRLALGASAWRWQDLLQPRGGVVR